MSKNTPDIIGKKTSKRRADPRSCPQITQKPLILAVETSGRTGSVAIAIGERLLAETTFSAPMRHSAEIFPAVCGLLERFSRQPQQIRHIYISIGPGSFTGLRIAATMAKTMHLANAAKVVTVDTSDIIAANVTCLIAENTVRDSIHDSQFTIHEKIATILDAKRAQFFIAVYQSNTSRESENTRYEIRDTRYGVWKKVFPDALMTASQFLEKFAGSDQPVWLLGEGLVYYKDKFKADGIRFFDEKYWTPRAQKVHLLGWQKALAGQFADPLTLQPTYLRRPV